MNINETHLQIERLRLKASTEKDPRAAEEAAQLAEALAASELHDVHRFSALVTALTLRSKYGLGFTSALLDVSARLEACSLDPVRKKAKRKNIAALARNHLDDPKVAAWLKVQDLNFTTEELTALVNEPR